MAAWDGGAFFGPLINTLRGCGLDVVLVDSLSLAGPNPCCIDQLAQCAARWLDDSGPVDVLVGNALGGALAQLLLPTTRLKAAVLLSAPTRVDHELERRLRWVVAAAERGGAEEAHAALMQLVRRRGEEPGTVAPPSRNDARGVDDSGTRLAQLRLLYGLDTSAAFQAYDGPVLQVVGEHSRLVGPQHLVEGANSVQLVVPDAGMRPHLDAPDIVSGAVASFVTQEVVRDAIGSRAAR